MFTEMTYTTPKQNTQFQAIELLHYTFDRQLDLLQLSSLGATQAADIENFFVDLLINYNNETLLGEEFIEEVVEKYATNAPFQKLIRSWTVSFYFLCNAKDYDIDELKENMFVSITGSKLQENEENSNFNNFKDTCLTDVDLYKDTFLVGKRIDLDNPLNSWFTLICMFLISASESGWIMERVKSLVQGK